MTGASSGIGRALSFEAAKAGYAVLLTARRGERLEDVAAKIRTRGGRCETLAADVAAAGSPERIVQTAVAAFGRIDVVVNNAGSGSLGDLLQQSDAALDAQWRLHVAAPLRLCRAALGQVERTHGAFVFLGSGLARLPLPGYGAYAAAKAAIRAVAIQLRRELRSRGIASIYVDPGLVATEFHGAMGTHRSRVPAVSPKFVARAILRGIRRRSARVNAVPWQTAGTVAGEWLGAAGDRAIEAMRPQRTQTASDASSPGDAVDRPPQPQPNVSSGLEGALEPVARRMERVKLPNDFVRSLLVPGTALSLHETAMRWAGMPNKNERAALKETLDALAAAGYLRQTGDETWDVVRAAD